MTTTVQPSIFDAPPPPQPPPNRDAQFNGADYVPDLDNERLGTQLGRIYRFMRDGEWRTVEQIHQFTGDPAPSILAQLGHLRKERFGAYLVERRAVEGCRGLYEFRVGGKGEGNPAPVRDTVAQLRRQVAELTSERDILRRQVEQQLQRDPGNPTR